MDVGFSPGELLSTNYPRNHEFFRSLFSRAVEAAKMGADYFQHPATVNLEHHGTVRTDLSGM
jgi:hypothetical protein